MEQTTKFQSAICVRENLVFSRNHRTGFFCEVPRKFQSQKFQIAKSSLLDWPDVAHALVPGNFSMAAIVKNRRFGTYVIRFWTNKTLI